MKITIENFEQEVLKSESPILLDFWATWCRPCQMQGPIIDEMESEGYHVGKVNVNEVPELAEKFQVMGVPTLVVIKEGKEVNRVVGLHTKEQLQQLLKNA